MGDEQDTSPSKLSKEELIQSMDRVDREIAKVEQQIFKLKKKQVGYLLSETFVSEHASNTMDVIKKTWHQWRCCSLKQIWLVAATKDV